MYELITGRRAWQNYIGKGSVQIYNLIHNCNYVFFQENKSTGKCDLDQLILDCVHWEQKQRPTAEKVLERIKII